MLLALADMVIAIFALESALLRADRVQAGCSERKQLLLQAVARTAAFDLVTQFQADANRCAAYVAQGTALVALQKTIARLTAYPVAGLLEAKQQLAVASTDAGAYPL